MYVYMYAYVHCMLHIILMHTFTKNVHVEGTKLIFILYFSYFNSCLLTLYMFYKLQSKLSSKPVVITTCYVLLFFSCSHNNRCPRLGYLLVGLFKCNKFLFLFVVDNQKKISHAIPDT